MTKSDSTAAIDPSMFPVTTRFDETTDSETADLVADLRMCARLLRRRLNGTSQRRLVNWCRWADDFSAGGVDGTRAGVESVKAHVAKLAFPPGSRDHRLAAAAEVIARAVFDVVMHDERGARHRSRMARQLLG